MVRKMYLSWKVPAETFLNFFGFDRVGDELEFRMVNESILTVTRTVGINRYVILRNLAIFFNFGEIIRIFGFTWYSGEKYDLLCLNV